MQRLEIESLQVDSSEFRSGAATIVLSGAKAAATNERPDSSYRSE